MLFRSWTEAVTNVSQTHVPDEVFEEVKKHFSEKEIVDLTLALAMRPYFSNSTEAARGFRDLGRAWEKIGTQQRDGALTAWGRRLQSEAVELRKDIDAAISRSILTVDGEKILPAIAGVKDPFHVVVSRDDRDPQYRSYRAYMEMMYSGSLTTEQARMMSSSGAIPHGSSVRT